MRSITIPVAIGFMIMIALGTTQAYPLQGGTGGVNCTLFGMVKTPIIGPDPNATVSDFALRLDLGLWGTDNATYELVDADDRVYTPDALLSRELQPGRRMLVFVVPTGDLFKLFRVIPEGGKPFAINWWKTPKSMNSQIVLRYYGAVDGKNTPDGQYVTYEVGIYNNGTTPVVTSPENFTMMDQWAWDYYTLEGFTKTELAPGNSIKTVINFTDLSPLSIPTFLVYDLFGAEPVIIDIDGDMGPLSDDVVYGTGASQAAESAGSQAETAEVETAEAEDAPETSAPAISSPLPTATTATPIIASPGNTAQKMPSLQDQIAAAKERLGSSGTASSTATNPGENLTSGIDAAKERLAKIRGGLKDTA